MCFLANCVQYLAKVTCPKRNGVCVGESDRTHPVGAGLKPDIARGVGAGLKPAPTTTPHTAEDRPHLCEYATIHTTRGAGNGVSISSQVKRFQAQDVLFGKLRPYPAYKSLVRSAIECALVTSDQNPSRRGGFGTRPYNKSVAPQMTGLYLCANASNPHNTRGNQ